MKRGLCGVYKITNNINSKFYIGSSVDISSRYSTHMGRDAKKYVDHPFYKEVNAYGKDNFAIEILELCDRESLIRREQFYFDTLNPDYNKVRPAENNFMHSEVLKKATKNSNTQKHVENRKKLYNSPEYKEYFRRIHIDKMKKVEMIKDDVILNSFISIREAARYITENTDYKGKNKASKIKDVCDGVRKTAYSFEWRYSKV